MALSNIDVFPGNQKWVKTESPESVDQGQAGNTHNWWVLNTSLSRKINFSKQPSLREKNNADLKKFLQKQDALEVLWKVWMENIFCEVN